MFRILTFAALFSFAGLSQAQTIPAQTIPAVQGKTDISPFDKKMLALEGIVTGVFAGSEKFGGFFLQDPKGDGDAATSDGIFVFQTPRAPDAQIAVQSGQKLRVTGRVSERFGQTQIGATKIEVLDAKPQPLAPTDIALPLPENTDFERFEGMLVRFAQTLFVGSSGDLLSSGALTLSSARQFNPTNIAPLSNLKKSARLDRVILDDGSNARYPKNSPYFDANRSRRVGSGVSGLVGILSYTYDQYRLQPTGEVSFQELNPRPLTPPAVGGNLKVAGANLYNFWTTLKNKDQTARGSESPAQFERQKKKTVAMIKGLDADVVGLMELENNELAVRTLVDALNAAYGAPTYDFVRDPQAGVGNDRIKVGFIYKPSRVALVGESLSDSSAIFDRKPVAQTFRDLKTGGVFSAVVNHFKSKGSPPETGDVDLGEGAWNQKRVEQSKALLGFIEQIKTKSGDRDVLALGDFNAYIEESPLLVLRDAGLKHLNLRLPVEKRYSFSFDGLFGSLDHAFATPELDGQIKGIGEWHINSDEPFFLAYNRVKVSDFQDNPFRASDHDPILLGLELK